MPDACPLTGPDTIRGLRGTIAKLEGSLKELRESAKLNRFTQMQKQLHEADKVKAALAALLTQSFGVEPHALQQHMKEAVMQDAGGERLYGASRELLLIENKALRSQLEQRLVTDKTAWLKSGASGGGVPASPDRSVHKDQDDGVGGAVRQARTKLGSSRMERARMLAGPQVHEYRFTLSLAHTTVSLI